MGQHAFGLDERHHLGQPCFGFQVGHHKGFEAFGRGAHAGGVGVHHVQVGRFGVGWVWSIFHGKYNLITLWSQHACQPNHRSRIAFASFVTF